MCFSRIHVTNSQSEPPLPFGSMNSKSGSNKVHSVKK